MSCSFSGVYQLLEAGDFVFCLCVGSMFFLRPSWYSLAELLGVAGFLIKSQVLQNMFLSLSSSSQPLTFPWCTRKPPSPASNAEV